MRQLARAFVLVAGVCWTITSASAQREISTSERGFEVVSIKPSPTTTRDAFMAAVAGRSVAVEPGGRWVVRHATLRAILRTVYPEYSSPGRIVGGPSWLDSQYFDIEGRADPQTSAEQITHMARRLLAERFQLKVRFEIRTVEVYALVLARADGRLGPGVQPAIDCADQGAPPDGRPHCRLVPIVENGVPLLSSGASPISDLIGWLQLRVPGPLIDRTGLSGKFAIRFQAPPVAALEAMPSGSLPPPIKGPDLLTALREQLGMRLDVRKEPGSVLVIERVEMPSPN